MEDCWGSLVLAYLGNDHGFISKEYIPIGMRSFGRDPTSVGEENETPFRRV